MIAPPRPTVADAFVKTDVVRYRHSGGPTESVRRRDAVLLESPLHVEVDGSAYTLLRTPGADRELVVGFLFTEGLISAPEDILLLAECPDRPDVIMVRTGNAGKKPLRTLTITSSCGLCGMEDIAAMVAALGRVNGGFRLSVEALCRLPEQTRAMQPLFDATGGAHAAALFDSAGSVACVLEDVGRHNALDQLIGHALLRTVALADKGVFLSGRTSLEMVAKAARARIPLVVAVGAPTSAAVEAADRIGLTLCGFVREERASVYTHAWRIVEAA
jgi:FdhD protein